MRKLSIRAGQRFGRLVTLRETGRNAHGKTLWMCRCDCGAEHSVIGSKLVNGESRSCGCLLRELRRAGALRRTHGRANSRAYMAWKNMLARCENPTAIGFQRYGGRGITVCERWHDLANFLAEMGEPPPGLTLERIDNDKGYSPDNCRWATRREQSHNTRQTRLLTVNGETHAIREWERIKGVNHRTIGERIKRGWSPEEAVMTPAERTKAGMPRQHQRRSA